MAAIESMHFFIELKVSRHIRLHRRHGIYDKKTPSSLHKNSLLSKLYMISNVIVTENDQLPFKNSFVF